MDISCQNQSAYFQSISCKFSSNAKVYLQEFPLLEVIKNAKQASVGKSGRKKPIWISDLLSVFATFFHRQHAYVKHHTLRFCDRISLKKIFTTRTPISDWLATVETLQSFFSVALEHKICNHDFKVRLEISRLDFSEFRDFGNTSRNQSKRYRSLSWFVIGGEIFIFECPSLLLKTVITFINFLIQ